MAILVRYFGLKEVEIAEDIVQDTLVEAMEKWSIQSIPDNPEAWLMDVARKKTINLLKRQQAFQNKILPNLTESLFTHSDFEEDSTLKMIFVCCHPTLSNEAQITLSLKTLCGLSVPEISNALLTNEATINKRLYRTKQKFRDKSIVFEIPKTCDLEIRLNNVFTTLYLLFNEGYYSANNENTIRLDFCFEAIRLLRQIIEAFPNSEKAKALLSLMLLTVSRFQSRIDDNGALIILAKQKRELWDKSLIAEGMYYLKLSTLGKKVNIYQLQAGIAAEHCLAPDFKATNWESVYKQYTILEKLENNVIIKFNKCIAQYYCGMKQQALSELLLLINDSQMLKNSHYHITMGVFYTDLQKKEIARQYFNKALQLSKSENEKKLIKKKLDE